MTKNATVGVKTGGSRVGGPKQCILGSMVTGDEDVLSKFLSFEGKYVSVGAVWRHNAPEEATRATVFSSRPHTMRDAVIPLLVP